MGNIDRREFIKLTGISAATVGISQIPEINAGDKIAGEIGEWIGSTCQGCTSWCSIQGYVLDGKVIKVRGNPNAKGNHGKICPRPHLAIQQLYDPDRVKTPLKRTNPKKGRNEDPKFIPISWDEAMDGLIEKISG